MTRARKSARGPRCAGGKGAQGWRLRIAQPISHPAGLGRTVSFTLNATWLGPNYSGQLHRRQRGMLVSKSLSAGECSRAYQTGLEGRLLRAA